MEQGDLTSLYGYCGFLPEQLAKEIKESLD
jgi:hypothetical protein